MANLTVWKFQDPEGAEQTLEKFGAMQKEHLVQVLDAAIVTWPSGKKRPRTRQAVNLVAAGSLDGAFWGMLFGLIFFVPFLGAAIGAAFGALSGSLQDFGIDDDFIRACRDEVTEGSSALFLLTRDETPDRIAEELAGTPMQLVRSNLSREQEEKLRETFPGA